MSIFAAIHGELAAAAMTGYQRIVHMRVTADALAGSLVAVPVTPERARVLGRLLVVPDARTGASAGVIADPMDYEAMLELLIHSADWAKLLTEVDAHRLVMYGTPLRVMGLPVTND